MNDDGKKRGETLAELALFDKNAARLAAFIESTNEKSDPDARTLLLRSALGFSEDEFTRCCEVLERWGLGRVSWLN